MFYFACAGCACVSVGLENCFGASQEQTRGGSKNVPVKILKTIQSSPLLGLSSGHPYHNTWNFGYRIILSLPLPVLTKMGAGRHGKHEAGFENGIVAN